MEPAPLAGGVVHPKNGTRYRRLIDVLSNAVIGGLHNDLIACVEVELVAVGSDLSVLGFPVWERDSAKVTEKDSWGPA